MAITDMSLKSQIPCRKPSGDSEKYEVLEKIGHGSFGVIHKVRRKTDGLIICRKEISYTRMSQKEREQLSAELSILKELRHKNIVAYYERDHFKSTQDLHLYMEYCGNGDLGRYIKGLKIKNEFADEDFVWTVFSQLVTALYRCHYGEDASPVQINSSGINKDTSTVNTSTSSFMILHRDLKPENVFLDENNSVKLGDFGLSKILQCQGFAETYVGTPFYMSPEICNGEKYTLYSDVWSLGCIIYELCARQPPFNATTHLALIQKIKSGKINRIPAQYSNDLQDLIVQCLNVNPNRRPDTTKLLNHARVTLMRKQQIISEWAADLSTKETLLTERTLALRDETEQRVRRECELKCTMEHTRIIDLAKMENLQSLQAQFESEVQRRVALEVEIQVMRIKQQFEQKHAADHHLSDSSLPSLSSGSGSQSSASEPDVVPNLPSGPLGQLKQGRGFKRGVRTPFSRAHTYSTCQPSPMDVTMLDPSPAPPVSNLNLSPRRVAGRIIFAPDNTRKWAVNGSHPPSPTMSIADDSDLEACLESLDTPTRVKPRESIHRPSSAMAKPPRMPQMLGQKNIVSKVDPNTFAAVRRPINIVPIVAASPTKKNIFSPQKFLPKRAAPLSPACRGEISAFQSKRGNEDLLKAALGKTLVELSHDRAKPKSSDENLYGQNRQQAYADPPQWDPLRDVMPSPFIVRMKRPDMMSLNAI